MSFLKTRIFATVLSIVAMTASPYMALAQSWSPPAGPPPDNNTPAPINVGSNEQTKAGPLKVGQYFQVDKNSTLFGQTVLRPDSSGAGFFASFLSNNFYGDVNLGDGTDPIAPVAINTNIFGQLNYKMADDNGDVVPPVSGYVLVTDAQGNASWADPSTIGAGGGSANLLPGTADGQTLRWNAGTSKWEPTSKVLIGDTTTTINNTTVALGTPTTNNIFITTGTNPGSKVTINSPGLKIPLGNTAAANRVLVSTDAQGTVAWANPASIGVGGGGGGNLPPGETGDTLWFDGASWLNTNKLQWNGTGNSLMFSGDDLLLPGNNQSLNPSAGRFLYSKDNQGKVSWNKTIKYEEIPVDSLTLDTIHILDADTDTSTFPAFVNDGFTVLNGLTTANDDVTLTNSNVRLTDSGAIYLENLSLPTNQELSGITQVCYNSGTGRLTRCTGVTSASGGVFGSNIDNDATLTFRPVDNGHNYIFDFSGNVDLEWCGGGGGGGGGGIGGPGPSGFVGGGGGGGGQKGQCQTLNNVHVEPGDVLTWSIGDGGNGGQGTNYDDYNGSSNQILATNGSMGEPTSVYLNGVQQGATQFGGDGGKLGQTLNTNSSCSANNGDIFPCGGYNGNLALALGTQAEQNYFNGQGGHFGGPGGRGGYGDTDLGMNIPVGGPGSGGSPGVAGDIGSSVVQGKSGKAGVDGGGGGGGGGSFAVPQNFIYVTGGLFGGQITGIEHMLNAGNGGKGGDGFVTIVGLPNIPQPEPTEIVYDTAGTFTFTPASLPNNAQHINIEVWGAGGGGGGRGTLGGEQAGGGGSGSYGRLENFPRPTGAVTVVVGAGGSAGTIGNTPSNGGNGGLSKFGTVIVAPGGNGGAYDNNGNGAGAGGNGGAVATGTTQNVPGTDGADGSVGGTGASGYQGFGSGGNGGQNSGANISSPTPGSVGRVRITWD